MAQYDVHRLGATLVVDCQSDLLDVIATRLVIPLAPERFSTIVARRLNPSFTVEGERVILVTQQAAAVPRTALGPPLASLADQAFAITGAIDLLSGGV